MTTESGEAFLKAMLPRCQEQVQVMVKADSTYRIGREARALAISMGDQRQTCSIILGRFDAAKSFLLRFGEERQF